MNYISNFESFNTNVADIRDYLIKNLLLDPGIDAYIDDIIESTKQQEHLSSLLKVCTDFCRPYICHYDLLRLNLVPRSEDDNSTIINYNRLISSNDAMSELEYNAGTNVDLSSPFFQWLKEHTAISFYYSWELQSTNPISLYKAITMSEDYENPDKTYITLKSRQANCLVNQLEEKYYQLSWFIGDNISNKAKGNDEKIIKIRPTITDHALILALIGKRLSIPYADKYRTKDYNYKTFTDLISRFTNVAFEKSSKNGKAKISPTTQLIFNNYLTERMLHFDFTNYIIHQYDSFRHSDFEITNTIFETLGEIAALPNVFSRISIAETIFNHCTDSLKDSNNPKALLRDWQVHASTLIRFLCRCAIPVLNLTFQYIMGYYVSRLIQCNRQKSKPDKSVTEEAIIPSLFDPYLESLSSRKDFYIYTRVNNLHYDENDPSAQQKAFRVQSIHSYNPKSLSYSTQRFFSRLARHIFFDIMSPSTIESSSINYHLYFNEQKIRRLQFETTQHLTEEQQMINFPHI